MDNVPTRTVFDVITDFLASDPTPEQILAYHLPDTLQQRAHDLLQRHTEDELTDTERDEMHAFMHADDMMALLKAKMKLKTGDYPC